jgi:hypothetical protein
MIEKGRGEEEEEEEDARAQFSSNGDWQLGTSTVCRRARICTPCTHAPNDKGAVEHALSRPVFEFRSGRRWCR